MLTALTTPRMSHIVASGTRTFAWPMRTRTLITGGCVAAFLLAAQPASAVVVLRVVDDDGQATPLDCNAGGAASAHTTITAAVTASSAGDFIKVCPGTYN